MEPARLNLPSCMAGWIRSHSIDHGNNQASSIFAKLSPLQGIYRHSFFFVQGWRLLLDFQYGYMTLLDWWAIVVSSNLNIRDNSN